MLVQFARWLYMISEDAWLCVFQVIASACGWETEWDYSKEKKPKQPSRQMETQMMQNTVQARGSKLLHDIEWCLGVGCVEQDKYGRALICCMFVLLVLGGVRRGWRHSYPIV